MKKLSKKQREQFRHHGVLLQAAQEDLEEAIDDYNYIVAREWEKVKQTKASFDAVVSDAAQFTEGVADKIYEYTETKTEKWRDGDKGERYYDWLSKWSTMLYPSPYYEWREPVEMEAPKMLPEWTKESYPNSPNKKK